MIKSTTELGEQAQLRLAAEHSLKKGNAPLTAGWSINPDTLALLYRLASNPESAGDALKLLHELQTHQVELDMQYGQLEANEQEYGQELERYKALFDFAPVGYFVLTIDGHIMKANLTGARLLGAEQEELGGRPVNGFFTPASRTAFAGLLQKLHENDSASCEVKIGEKTGDSRSLGATAEILPGSEAVLLVLCEFGRSPGV